MQLSITGTLEEVFKTEKITDRFKKREFILKVVETVSSKDYTNYIKFQLTGDRCSVIDKFELNDEVEVFYNIKGRKYEKDGKVSYFTNLEAWKISYPEG